MNRQDFLIMLDWALVRLGIKRKLAWIQAVLEGKQAFSRPQTAVTGAYAISTTTDYVINCASGSFTVTLPSALSVSGREFVIKNNGTGVITIATTSGQTIDGLASEAIKLPQYSALEVVSTGTQWAII